MNRIINICFIVLLFSFSACSWFSGKEKLHINDLSDIKKNGKLVAVTDFNSINYFIYRGTPMGFQYDLLTLFTKQLGVQLEIKVSNYIDDNLVNLQKGHCDLVALNLTVTKKRSKEISFSEPIMETNQVLIQRKPTNYRKMNSSDIEQYLLRNQLDMAGKTIYVQEHSAYAERLHNLSDEIGDSINVIEVPMVVEELVKLVSEGEIDYTVCDANVAIVNSMYFPNIDIQTPLSFPQHIAWAVNRNSDELVDSLNSWIREFRKTIRYRILYDKYYNDRKAGARIQSEFYTLSSGKISSYDNYIKKYSELINWDWRLLASLIYQESLFNPNVRSWAGAYGLMQLMPSTASAYGVTMQSSPAENILGGVRLLKWLNSRIATFVNDPDERLKFVLASYNVGLGHILDARRLAEKYGKDPNKWDDNVDFFLLNKSKPGYYRDPVVSYGYCRGEEPYYYVKEILERYEHYRNLIKK